MAKSAEATSDVPLESSIPAGAVPLESILCTDKLHRRRSRPPDYEKENRALVALVSALAESPSTILQTLAETILDITRCDSAGLSLLTSDGKTPDVRGKRFYWPAIAGVWNPHVGGGTPRNFGPCGDVLDQNRTLLFKHFERRYPYLRPVVPAAEECLLVPFYVAGKGVGTIWAIMHSDRRQFDAEDDRVMDSLGKFASSAYQALIHIEDLEIQVSERQKAEAEVRELARGLEAKIRRLVEANVVGIIIWNLEGAITSANDAFLRMVQYDCEDVASGRVRWTDLTPAEWRDHDERAVADLKATGIVQPFEKEYFRKDGSRVAVLLGGALFEGRGNEGVAFVLELTERKLAQNALRESQENLARTEQFSLVMATHTDLEGRWLKVPPTLCKLLGYTEEELLGRRFHEFTHPDDAEADWNQCSRLIRGEIKSFDLEKRCIRKDGSIVWVYLNASIVSDANGAPVHFRTYIRDITQRKQQEQALRQSEERYRTLAETATDVILTIDQMSTILFVNRAVEKAFGYTPAEIIGQKITLLMPERMRHRHEEAMRRYLATGEKRISWNAVSLPGLHKNGREISLDVSFAEMGTGDERFFSGILRDVTERKRTEETLDKARAQLADVARIASLGVLTASIAHELNQPLSGIVTNANTCLRKLARDSPDLEGARETARRTVRDGNRASEMIARLRALFTKKVSTTELLDLNEATREVVALLSLDLQRNRVILRQELADDLPPVVGDRVQLQQVILNLIRNASDAMSDVDDRPRHLLITTELDEGSHVRLTVRDAGVGLEPQSVNRLFEAFYSTKTNGMGIGLSVSRTIIESHHGRLWAELNDGPGATFSFSVPGDSRVLRVPHPCRHSDACSDK